MTSIMSNIVGILGQIVVTRGIHNRMKIDPEFEKFVYFSLNRYSQKDWGDSPSDDKVQNNESVKYGKRILAVYTRPGYEEDTIWIITEWDRSYTTILFPDEY